MKMSWESYELISNKLKEMIKTEKNEDMQKRLKNALAELENVFSELARQ